MAGAEKKVAIAIKRLHDAGIIVSLFLDPDPCAIELAYKLGADVVELHTGQYALAKEQDQAAELKKHTDAARLIVERGLTLHAGHGLTYRNVLPIARLPQMCELNIGHSIVARALMVGFQAAVREMKQLVSA